MTGGGFGGSCIAIVRTGDADAVAAAIGSAFAEHGFAAPLLLTVTASGPAHRDR